MVLVVINLADEEKRVPLEVAGGAPATASLILLDPEHNAIDLGQQPFLEDGALTLPPQSVTLYILENK